MGALIGLLVRALEVKCQDAEQDDDETLATHYWSNNAGASAQAKRREGKGSDRPKLADSLVAPSPGTYLG